MKTNYSFSEMRRAFECGRNFQLTGENNFNELINEINKAKKPPATEYQSCLSVYNDFIISKTGLPAKINGAEGNAMKQIIAYLHRAVTDKSDKGVPDAIKYIFENWDRLEPFLQNQLKLTQINGNLVNILNQLKNGTSKNKSYEQKLAENYRAAGIDTAKF